MKNFFIFSLILLGLITLTSCNFSNPLQKEDININTTSVTNINNNQSGSEFIWDIKNTWEVNKITQIANPASTNCVNKWWQLKMENISWLWEYWVCIFEDNRQCEEWALFRWECPEWGVKVTWYTTEAAKMCAISWWDYVIKLPANEVEKEKWNCIFKDIVCDAEDYYFWKCKKDWLDSQLIKTVSFKCKEDKIIESSFYKDYVKLKLNDWRNFILTQWISASWVRYINKDESVVFWDKWGKSFLLENNKETFSECNEIVK